MLQTQTRYWVVLSLNYYPIMETWGRLLGYSAHLVVSIFGQPAANAASADGSQYTLCSDPSISSPFGSDPIAAGPFCNIEYGIPPKYLDKDPEQVAHELQDKGQIDPITGDVIPQKDPPISIPLPGDTSTQDQKGSLSGWIDLCTDGSNAHAADCQITDDTADYALYVIDHRIQTTMDGEDATLDPSTAPATPSAPAVVAPVVPAATTVPTNTTTPSTPAVSTPTTTPPAVPVTGGGTGTSFIDTQYLTTSKLLAYMMPPKKIESITI
jgi:cell division septation protein DedD